jgi:hypothetical protein
MRIYKDDDGWWWITNPLSNKAYGPFPGEQEARDCLEDAYNEAEMSDDDDDL